MSETELRAEAGRWLRYAREDLIAAEFIPQQPTYAPRHACFLAQQAAEKALKAAIPATGPTRRAVTHDKRSSKPEP